MPRQTKNTGRSIPTQTLIIDNGGYTIKAGWAKENPDVEKDCHVIPNCMARGRDKRVWIAGQIESCRDFGEMAFRRPVEKGYLVNWEAEKEIWDHTFFDKNAKLKCDPHEANLILTEALNAPASLQTNCDQMIFEEYEFAAYYRCAGPPLNAYNDIQAVYAHARAAPQTPDSTFPSTECVLVVDSGFSHTTVTPVLRGQAIQGSVRRLDIGGKLLTNYLKELVSIRHYNMMDETYLMNQVKEAACYISLDFERDLARAWKGGVGDQRRQPDPSVVIDYVLPDYDTHKKGFVRAHDTTSTRATGRADAREGGAASNRHRHHLHAPSATTETHEDAMTLGNERFAVPELLFTPGDVGMKQAGIPQLIMQSLSTLPGGLWPAMLANVYVVGGNALIEGFVQRL
ncbi:MAG: Actin- protein 6 [Thelocarpon superellum]|nr:MAG: Actin- protein 6 [Thelocarpon superellum]